MAELSVIIPVYKVEKYLCRCLDSIINQTFTDLEIIIIDDGSPDICGEICEEYAKKDRRIRLIHKVNGGLCAARNDGISMATGKWITFVDSDDWCEIDYYEKMFQELKNIDTMSNIEVFIAGGHFLEYEKKQIKKYNSDKAFYFNKKEEMEYLQAKILAPQYGMKNNVFAASLGAPWDKLYNAEFLKKNHLFFDIKSKAREDLLFNFQVFSMANFVAGGICFGYHYRMVRTSITKKYNPQKSEINYYFLNQIYDLMMKNENSKPVQDAFYVRSINLLADLLECDILNKENHKKINEKIREIKEAKNIIYYENAIFCKSNNYLSKRQKVLKYFLKRKSVLPLVILISLDIRVKEYSRRSA